MSLDAYINGRSNDPKPMLGLLYQQMQRCTDCKYAHLSVNCIKKLWGKPGEKRILVISQNPSWYWYEKKYSLPHVMGALDGFDKKFGGLLSNFMSKVGINWKDFYITNVMKCATENNSSPLATAVDRCAAKWLVQELVIIRPKKIVVLGSVAKQCVEKMVHVMAMKGNVVYLPHPSSIKTKEEALGFSRAFVEAIKWKSSS